MALIYLQCFKVGKIMVLNYGYLMSTQWHFHIKFPYEGGTGNLQMIINKF